MAVHGHLETIGGTVESVCQSKLCIFASVDDGWNDTLTEDVAPSIHSYLRRALMDQSFDDDLVSRVTILTKSPSSLEEGELRSDRGTIETMNNRRVQTTAVLSNSFPGLILNSIQKEILIRRAAETNMTLHNGNRLTFLSFPVFCNSTLTYNSNITTMPLEGTHDSCPQNVTVQYEVWEPGSFQFSNQVQEFSIQTSALPSESCESILGPGMCVDEQASFTGVGEVILQWRNHTSIKTIDWADYLPLGLTYYINVVFDNGLMLYSSNFTLISLGPTITPSYANTIYNVPEGHQGAGLGVTALFIPGANAYSQPALELANTAFNLPTPTVELFTSKIFPAMNISQCFLPSQNGVCSESNLDVQLITQYGTGAQFGFIPSDHININSKLTINATILQTFIGYREALIEKNIYPHVLSLSFGGTALYEPDLEDILMTFSAAGISVLAASGDNGAAGDGCGINPYAVDFPVMPAMYPWVLAVGATQQARLPGKNGQIGTIACMGPTSLLITSTGKISFDNTFPMPAYQKKAVLKYLNSAEFRKWPYPPRFIPNPGRSIPDVSAFGAFIPISLEQGNGTVLSMIAGGTSAAVPAFAGLLLQVRGALLQRPECANKTIQFGHINPMIYWMASDRPNSFIDITIGNNVFNGQGDKLFDLQNCGEGFVTAKGWDPVTGVGMMNFTAFVDAAVEWICTGIHNNSNNNSNNNNTSKTSANKAKQPQGQSPSPGTSQGGGNETSAAAWARWGRAYIFSTILLSFVGIQTPW